MEHRNGNCSILKTILEKEKNYDNVRFSADTLREAIQVFRTQDESNLTLFMSVTIDDSEWTYDSEEEFFAGASAIKCW